MRRRAVLSLGEIFAILKGEDLPGPLAAILAAIARAESAGNPRAVNEHDGGGASVGLFQIHEPDHPALAAQMRASFRLPPRESATEQARALVASSFFSGVLSAWARLMRTATGSGLANGTTLQRVSVYAFDLLWRYSPAGAVAQMAKGEAAVTMRMLKVYDDAVSLLNKGEDAALWGEALLTVILGWLVYRFVRRK